VERKVYSFNKHCEVATIMAFNPELIYELFFLKKIKIPYSNVLIYSWRWGPTQIFLKISK